jgi:ubiquinone biosynthesis monooxygenase Coq7
MSTPDSPVTDRHYSLADRLLIRAQGGLALLGARRQPVRHPGSAQPEARLTPVERRHAAGLMRINHAGEVAAQALYHGQALVARDRKLRGHLLVAASEERAHLRWCGARLRELHAHASVLDPLWYAGSFGIGAAAGLVGDRTSLGFVEETERQVAAHLDDHLARLPKQDDRSRAILAQMKRDEERHGAEAAALGAKPISAPVRLLMRGVAGVMKTLAYRI